MHFGIFGAGSVGCYVGGMLAANGESVTLVGRPAMAGRLAAGIDLTRQDGLAYALSPQQFVFATGADALGACDTVFVCVKSGDTADAGRTLSTTTRADATVVSLQNGVSNGDTLRTFLPGRRVLSGMVPFNVARIGESRFHCGTEGEIVIEDDGAAHAIVERLNRAGVPASTSKDINAILWGKLVMNLNNAVNVLSGLPLKAQLSDRSYRRVLSASMREAMVAMSAAGIVPARVGRVHPRIAPVVLDLPNWLFRIVAASMLKIDAQARSSMAEDLEAGRKPEIGYLNGEIVRLGESTGTPTPVNTGLTELVMQAFSQGTSPRLSGGELAARLGL